MDKLWKVNTIHYHQLMILCKLFPNKIKEKMNISIQFLKIVHKIIV